MNTVGKIYSGASTLIHMFLSSSPPRSNNFRIHRHTELELNLILKGSGIYKVLDKAMPISQGDILVFRTNEAHCATDIFDTDIEMLNIRFAPRIMWMYESPLNQPQYARYFSADNSKFQNIIKSGTTLNQSVKNTIISIQNEFSNKQSDYAVSVKILLLFILIEVSRNRDTDAACNKTQITNSTFSCLEKAVAFMNNNFCESLSLNQISAFVNLSPTYFSACFKKLNGISPWNYILLKRIEKAAALLKSTDENILDIAIQCGFNSSADFNKVFKKITGVVPKIYRK